MAVFAPLANTDFSGRLPLDAGLEPAVLGLGIDEDTGIVVRGNEFEVFGFGSVTVVDETTATYNNLYQI